MGAEDPPRVFSARLRGDEQGYVNFGRGEG